MPSFVVRGLSSPDRRVLWDGWKAGQTFEEISSTLGKGAGSVYSVLRRAGGMAPAERKRSARALSLAEREEVSRGLAVSLSLGAIAARLGRAKSSISREVARNGGASRYRATEADDRGWRAATRPKQCLLARVPALCAAVASKLEERWSPGQISAWLKAEYRDDNHSDWRAMQVSPETIYKSLFIQARGVLKTELLASLRSRRKMRRPRAGAGRRSLRGQIVDAISIRERPAEAQDRAVPGHWEGDLLSGKANTHIATLVERRSRYVVLVRLPSRQSKDVIAALTEQVHRMPEGLMVSLTWDRGKEMAEHHRFTMATSVNVYFCDPHSPWQRGSNENTNGLLRQYFPKGTDLSVFSQEQLNEVARQLNTRPRMTLGYQTPAFVFAQTVATTS
jgi:IS30 family transposase